MKNENHLSLKPQLQLHIMEYLMREQSSNDVNKRKNK